MVSPKKTLSNKEKEQAAKDEILEIRWRLSEKLEKSLQNILTNRNEIINKYGKDINKYRNKHTKLKKTPFNSPIKGSVIKNKNDNFIKQMSENLSNFQNLGQRYIWVAGYLRKYANEAGYKNLKEWRNFNKYTNMDKLVDKFIHKIPEANKKLFYTPRTVKKQNKYNS